MMYSESMDFSNELNTDFRSFKYTYLNTSTMNKMNNSTFNALSASQREMDSCRNLEPNRYNGAEMRRTRSLQHISTALQKQQHNLPRRSQSTPSADDKSAWVHVDSDNYCMGRPMLYVYQELLSSNMSKKKKEKAESEIHKTKNISTKTCESDNRLDKYFATNKPRFNVSSNDKCCLENQTQEDNCSFFWSINCREAQTKETHDHNSTEYRSAQLPPTYSPPGSASGSDSENGALGPWKLLRNEYLDSSESSEATNTNSNLHKKSGGENNIVSLPKLQDVPCQLFNRLKDELSNFSEKELPLNDDRRNHFAKIFGITEVLPLYLSNSGCVLWFLDKNRCLFMWNQMDGSMIFMGSTLEEGITNYLIHPEKMCYIIEDTFERIPINEYEINMKEEFENCIKERLKEQLLIAKAEIAENISKEKNKKKKKKSNKNK